MKKHYATWRRGTWVDGESLPMCSRSEADESFLVGAGWELNLPTDWGFFKTTPTVGDCMEVVGKTSKGQEIHLGYACPLVFVLNATVYSSFEECMESDFFHPSDYIKCRMEDINEAVNQQLQMMEDECYGD